MSLRRTLRRLFPVGPLDPDFFSDELGAQSQFRTQCRRIRTVSEYRTLGLFDRCTHDLRANDREWGPEIVAVQLAKSCPLQFDPRLAIRMGIHLPFVSKLGSPSSGADATRFRPARPRAQ